MIESIEKTISLFKSLKGSPLSKEILDEASSMLVIKNILKNFSMFTQALLVDKTHGKGTLDSNVLNHITLGNEYDVQRFLYSLLKPIFPSIRQEVTNDTGYSTKRCDIILDKYKIVIEVKCTRENMSERKLTEELGSDAFHYEYNHLFFFIYDKNRKISNATAFKECYSKFINTDGKHIETFITQPKVLV